MTSKEDQTNFDLNYAVNQIKLEYISDDDVDIDYIQPEDQIYIKQEIFMDITEENCYYSSITISEDTTAEKSPCSEDESKRYNMRKRVEKTYQCTTCHETFKSVIARNKHMNMHLNIDTTECSSCNKPFEKKILLSHISGKDNYECKICKKEFKSKACLSYHKKKEHVKVGHKCTICSKLFCSKNYLTVHMRKHYGDKPFECPVCNKAFASQPSIKYHLSTHDKKETNKCEICDKYFSSYDYLQIHKRKHSGDKPLLCPICNTGYASAPALKYHMTHRHKEEMEV